jgi:hypothetical protein
MSPAAVFQIHLVLGYVPWLLCFGAYVWPRLKAMDQVEAQRAIATLHSFRFFGLVFIVPGVVGPNLPAGFATFAAYGDFATGVLAMLALLTVKISPLFWSFIVAFNLVGAADIIIDYYHGNQLGLPALAGELGATYVIPIVYVPLLMITHVVAFYLLVRQVDQRQSEAMPQPPQPGPRADHRSGAVPANRLEHPRRDGRDLPQCDDTGLRGAEFDHAARAVAASDQTAQYRLGGSRGRE